MTDVEIDDIKMDKTPPPEPKKTARKNTGSVIAPPTKALSQANITLAKAATDTLIGINQFAVLGCRVAQLNETALVIEDTEDEFRERVYQALLLDPELCKTIVRGGGMTGKMALVFAYVMLGTKVVPVASMELATRRAEKQLAREEDLRNEAAS